MKEIANTRLLVSVSHSCSTSANLEVFDVSRKGQTKKIYSFKEVLGSKISLKSASYVNPLIATGEGDVAYNSRRSIFGAIPVRGKIAYHLFYFGSSKAGNIVKLIQKPS